MRFPTIRSSALTLAALAVGLFVAGCRRVTVVSFRADVDPAPAIDTLIVAVMTSPAKPALSLSGLNQTIGYYDLESDQIDVEAWGCLGNELVLHVKTSPPIVANHVTVTLMDVAGDHAPCVEIHGGTVSGTGGAAGQGVVPGTGGGGGAIGTGGSPGAGGSILDGTDAGTDAGSAAECGDTHEPPVCEPPAGDAGTSVVPEPVVSPDCDTYCTNMGNTCPGNYDSPEACRRYCATAGWSMGSLSGSGDTLGCRNYYLSLAANNPSRRASFCADAASEGSPDCGTTPCATFCNAWGAICQQTMNDVNACVATCGTQSATAPFCRIRLLQKAVFDRHYCDYVSFNAGSCLVCN